MHEEKVFFSVFSVIMSSAEAVDGSMQPLPGSEDSMEGNGAECEAWEPSHICK